MAAFFQKFLGGQPADPSRVLPVEDADFADFAHAPDPSPISIPSVSVASAAAPTSIPTAGFQTGGQALRPYTKWYRIWERVTIRDFYSELIILPFIIALVLVHIWGTRKNKRKAKGWIAAHAPVLHQEFASVGFAGIPRAPSANDFQSSAPADLLANDDLVIPEELLKEKSATEYVTYASGRQNVAFVDIKLSLAKRYSPVGWFGEEILGFFFESQPAPRERMEATNYVFDGKEGDLVPSSLGKSDADQKKEKFNSTYDGFVWAVVHKGVMRQLREGRYDLSLTTTKDHQKLPNWATVMSESAEITEILLTPELVKAVHDAGEALEALVISDQPIDQPKKLNDAIPKKRISLSLRLPTDSSAYITTIPLFRYFLRLPDQLVAGGRFRPEVMRRVKQTREDEMKKMKRVDEGEKAEERRTKSEKEKKEKRDAALKGMSAEEQKKFLEKERALDMRRSQKRKSVKA